MDRDLRAAQSVNPSPSRGAGVYRRVTRKMVPLASSLTSRAPSRVTATPAGRPQALSLLTLAAENVGLTLMPTRHTPALHQWLRQKAEDYPTLANFSGAAYDPLHVDSPPPLPLSENLWGDRWGFVTLSAGDFERTFPHEPIPIRQLPPEWLLELESHFPMAATGN